MDAGYGGIMSDSVELYTTDDGVTSLLVRTDAETVWLTRQQLAVLFGRDVKTIGKHIANALREELEGEAEATVAKFATVQSEGQRSVTRNVEHYNLDLIISIGYRVKSSEGVRFRKWATDVLREYLIEGAATNQRRLDQLNKIVQVLGRSDDRLVAGVADVLSSFLPAMTMLREFDEGHIPTEPRGIPDWTLTLDEARQVIRNADPEPSRNRTDRLCKTEYCQSPRHCMTCPGTEISGAFEIATAPE